MSDENNQIILTIDDDPVTLNLIVAILKKWYKVRPFISADTAFCYLALSGAESKADLILLDYHMPDFSGPEVLRKLKSEPNYASIPVIFLTGRAGENAVDDLELLALGAVDVIGKPPSAATLCAKIESHLATV